MPNKPSYEELEQRVEALEQDASERKKAEEVLLQTENALRQSEERYQIVTELTSDYAYAFRVEPDGKLVIEWVTGALKRITGFTEEELHARGGWESLIYPDDISIPLGQLDALLKNQSKIAEYRILTKNEEIRWMRDYARPVWDNEQGQLTHIYGAVQDITQRKRTEEALKHSEEKYRELVQNANCAILRLDTQGRITFFNEFAQSFFGYTEDEILHQNVVGTIVPQTESSGRDLKAMIEDIIGNPSEYVHNENENTKENGERTWIAWRNKAIFGQDGRVSEILAVGMDITDRKQAEQELRESEERFKLFMGNSPAVTYMKDLKGKYVYFSERYFDIWGEQAKDWIGKNDEELWSPEIAQQFQRNDAVALTKGEPIEMIESWETPDGPTEWRTYKFPVQDTAGKTVFLAGMAVDITEQKRLEAQFKQAQKMEAIGTLAGGIAHDFNNILSAVIGYTELALTDAEEATQLYANLQEVLRAGGRAKDLVKQILAFSRQAEQERKPVHVKLIAKEAVKFLRASLPTTIEIRHDIQSDSLVMADPTQIHQVLMNLCTNAGHAMREKGGVLGIKLADVRLKTDFTTEHPELQPGPHLQLTVSDTGHGIPAHVLDRIFDPFFTTKEKTEGTGMGLAVVHGIVGTCGGTIIASSEPGEGSIFKVYLPSVERHHKPQAQAEEAIAGGTERILLVDDEPALVNIGKQILQSLGYKVTTRTSSLETLELFRAKADRFDLVITDMTMPNMAGDELARELIRISPEIPVILCTGYSSRINKQQAIDMGIRAFVSKPVLKKEIAETIRKVLEDK